METKLTNTCNRLRPGINIALPMAVMVLGAAVGGAVGAFIEGPIGLAVMLGGAFISPMIVGFIGSMDSRLSDDECKALLDAAETPAEQSFVRELYCKKGCLMKSDANLVLDWVQQQQHTDLQLRMECVG